MTANMKNSGVDWIGEIPENWEVMPVKYHFFSKKEVVGNSADNYERLALTLHGVIKRSKEDSEGLQPEKFETYQIVRNNYLIFKLIDLENIKTSRVGLSEYEGIVSPAYIILISNGDILPEYAEKYFLNLWYQHIFNDLGSAGVRSNLNKEDLLNLPIIKPTIPEQKKISNFLNEKIKIIDNEIDNAENLIKKYNEYKQSLITEVVTKGLNPKAHMKSSGAQWMPVIPKHWETAKFKFHLQVDENKGFPNLEVLSLYREYGVIPKNSRDDNHNVTSEDTSSYKHVVNGNFVVNKMKAWQGSVAVSEYEGIISPAYYVYKFTSQVFNPRFFHYMIRNRSYAPEFRRLSGGIREGQWDLSRYSLENILILIPPIKEQNEIVKFLDEKCNLIDSLILEKERIIKELEEYKKSLIFEYVTGKKEVPE